MEYNLKHLTQEPHQRVLGPIQDDEALLLYAICRVCCVRRVLELGGLHGYSARNFVAAVGPEGKVYTVDNFPLDSQGCNHVVVVKDIGDVTTDDVDNIPLDLVFFDCHTSFPKEFAVFNNLTAAGIIDCKTILAIHDTGLHPNREIKEAVASLSGYIHQPDAMTLMAAIVDKGWKVVNFKANKPLPPLAFRHGLAICMMY